MAKVSRSALELSGRAKEEKSDALPKDNQRSRSEVFADVFEISSAPVYRMTNGTSRGNQGPVDEDLFIKFMQEKITNKEYPPAVRKGTMSFRNFLQWMKVPVKHKKV